MFWLFCVCFSRLGKVQEFLAFLVTTPILDNPLFSRANVSANADVRARVHVNAAVKVQIIVQLSMRM